MKARAGILLGCAVSLVAAAWLLFTTDVGTVASRVTSANVVWLGPAILLLAVQAGLRAARWSSLIGAATTVNLPVGRAADAMLVGYLVNAVLPGRAGEVARTFVIARRESTSFGRVAASVVVERAVDLMALAGLAAAPLALIGNAWALPAGALAIGIGAILAFHRHVGRLERLIPRRAPQRLADGFHDFVRAVVSIPAAASARAAVMSALAWLGDAGLVLLVARALALDVSPAQALLIGLGGALGTALPAAPGYLATYELGAVAFGTLGGLASATVLPVALVAHLIGVGFLSLGGAVALGRVISALGAQDHMRISSVKSLARAATAETGSSPRPAA